MRRRDFLHVAVAGGVGASLGVPPFLRQTWAQGGPIKIGMPAALSGSHAQYGIQAKRAASQVLPSSVLRQTSSLTTVKTALGGPATTRTLWTSWFGIWPFTFVHVSPPSTLCRTPSTSSPTHTCR